eukprot:GGOE01044297.1.p2 GENE.GGOE01044297.1~~GGOE01044297.1.p2  ORF type:complete len:140 (+),score=25.99 GGOE01044297.1:72-491(+)
MSQTDSRRHEKCAKWQVRREFDFDNRKDLYVPHTPYNSLHDPGMQRFFSNSAFRKHLRQHDLIDDTGHILDLDKHKAKLRIIEQEWMRKNADIVVSSTCDIFPGQWGSPLNSQLQSPTLPTRSPSPAASTASSKRSAKK